MGCAYVCLCVNPFCFDVLLKMMLAKKTKFLMKTPQKRKPTNTPAKQ